MIFIEVSQKRNYLLKSWQDVLFTQVLVTEIYPVVAGKGLKNTKEENLKPKESENCLHIHKYLKIIPRKSHYVDDEYPSTIEHVVFFWVNTGGDTLIYISHYSDSVSW